MSAYRRVLALLSLNADAEAVAKRAAEMARFHGATLALASIVDYSPGFEVDHVPFKTPGEMRQAIVDDVAGKVDAIAAKFGGGEVIVAAAKECEAVQDIARSWQPDLILVSARATHGLDGKGPQAKLPFDVLIVQPQRQGYVGRLINALSFPF